jgi:hypothetical protein
LTPADRECEMTVLPRAASPASQPWIDDDQSKL